MNALRHFAAESLWLAGAAAFAFFFFKTFLAIQVFALLITTTLRIVERSFRANAKPAAP
jgi:hypothetical protein